MVNTCPIHSTASVGEINNLVCVTLQNKSRETLLKLIVCDRIKFGANPNFGPVFVLKI